MVSEEYRGTEKWILTVLKENKEGTTAEIMDEVKIYNQDCADRIPMALTQMRMEGTVGYKVVAGKEGLRKNIVWYLISSSDDS